MAEKKGQNVSAGLMSAEEGWTYVKSLEDNSVNQYLAVYQARIEAYRIEAKDYGTKVTMKLSFPLATNPSNVNLWTFFIAQAAHKIGKKPFIEVHPAEQGFVGYCSFIIFGSPKYIESKGGRSNDF